MDIKEITPKDFIQCGGGVACPSVFETEEDTLMIIGKIPSPEKRAKVDHKVGTDEFVVEIPRKLVEGAL